MRTVLFIHGMFMNSKSWEPWLPYFENRGYKVLAPDWPFHEGNPSALRENISPGLGKLGLSDLVDYYAGIIRSLPDKPIIIGHSMGGLVAQLIVEQDLAHAAVCLSSAPPRGVISFKYSFLKGNFPTVNPLKGDSPCIMTVPRFQYMFCNTMTLEETAKVYEQYVVPETRNAARASTGKAGAVDFKKPHPPMLFIAGREDNITPASLILKNAKKYTNLGSITDYKEFPNRTHFIYGQKDWEEVADYTLNWLESHASA